MAITFDKDKLERWKRRRYGSTDVQHDLFRSGHDLDLRSNFQYDLLRSNYNSFYASRQEENDAVKINECFTESTVNAEKLFIRTVIL